MFDVFSEKLYEMNSDCFEWFRVVSCFSSYVQFFRFPHKHADMKIYVNFTERIEAYDGHYVRFVDKTHFPVKTADKNAP